MLTVGHVQVVLVYASIVWSHFSNANEQIYLTSFVW